MTERRDFLELCEGVLYGVSAGVGKDTTVGGTPSSSVSQAVVAIMGLMMGNKFEVPRLNANHQLSEDTGSSHFALR